MNASRIFSQLFAFFALAAMLGCATGPKFKGPKATRDDAALLYIYRPFNPPLLPRATIKVNGVPVAKLTNRGYFDLELQPGTYVIKADWGWTSGVRDGEFTLQAEHGRTYYVSVETGMVYRGFAGAHYFNYPCNIGLADDRVATNMIASCGEVKKRPGIENLLQPK